MITLQDALKVAGLVHLGILVAGSMVPRKLNWKEQFQVLSPLNRNLFWTYGFYVFCTILSIGLTTFLFASSLADGSTFSRYLCGLFFLFWAGRIVIAIFFFDVSEHLTSRWYRVGYFALNASFAVLSVIYAWGALHA